MANIGAGERLKAYLVKFDKVNLVDAYLKETVPNEEIELTQFGKLFKYRFLTNNEMTFQPISSYLKGKFDSVIFSSDTLITPNQRDVIYFVNGFLKGKKLRISRVIPQVQLGMFLINNKAPNILELE